MPGTKHFIRRLVYVTTDGYFLTESETNKMYLLQLTVADPKSNAVRSIPAHLVFC